MALPLLAGGHTIGALDLQSTEADAFAPDVIPILQSLADQLAVAIENARLFTQTQTSMRELEELAGEVTERSWADFLQQARETEKRQVFGPETQALETQRSSVVKRVLNSGGVIIADGQDGRQAFLAAPIVVRGEVVGVLGVEPDGTREWTQDDVTLLQGIAERTALAVENGRLYLQAQRAADRERLVNNIAAKLQRAPSLQLLLESVARELAGALGTDNVYAEISLGQAAAARDESAPPASEAVEGQARPTEPSEKARANS
jgi:GAF domain-containing protein